MKNNFFNDCMLFRRANIHNIVYGIGAWFCIAGIIAIITNFIILTT